MSDGTCAYATEILANTLRTWLSPQHHLTGRHACSMSMSDGTCAYATEILANAPRKWLSLRHHLSGPHANSMWESDGTCAYAAEIIVNMIAEMAKSTRVSQRDTTSILC
jgi:hypothetical protein